MKTAKAGKARGNTQAKLRSQSYDRVDSLNPWLGVLVEGFSALMHIRQSRRSFIVFHRWRNFLWRAMARAIRKELRARAETVSFASENSNATIPPGTPEPFHNSSEQAERTIAAPFVLVARTRTADRSIEAAEKKVDRKWRQTESSWQRRAWTFLKRASRSKIDASTLPSTTLPSLVSGGMAAAPRSIFHTKIISP